MKKWQRYVLGALLVLVLVGFIGLLIADSRYKFLFAAPSISHETLISPDTSIRVVVAPPLAQDFALKILRDKAPPRWMLSRAMPREVAVLASPDLVNSALNVRVFVNEQRLGPAIAQVSETVDIQRGVPYLNWVSNGFAYRERGVLVLEGDADLNPSILETIQSQWGIVSDLTHPQIEGGNLLEMVADNRDGSLFALLAFLIDQNVIPAVAPAADLAKQLFTIGEVRITANFETLDVIRIVIVIECSPQVDEGAVSSLSFLLGGALAEAANQLEEKYGATFSGTKEAEGYTITVDYTLSEFDRLLPNVR